MRNLFLIFISIFFFTCHSNINEIEFNENPFDDEFDGEIIEVVKVYKEEDYPECKIIRLDFRFLPQPLETFKRVSENKPGFFNVFFKTYDIFNWPIEEIYDAEGNELTFPDYAVYNPGISSFEMLHADEVYSFFTIFPVDRDLESKVEVFLLVRDRPNANLEHRKEILKQTLFFQCPQ